MDWLHDFFRYKREFVTTVIVIVIFIFNLYFAFVQSFWTYKFIKFSMLPV